MLRVELAVLERAVLAQFVVNLHLHHAHHVWSVEASNPTGGRYTPVDLESFCTNVLGLARRAKPKAMAERLESRLFVDPDRPDQLTGYLLKHEAAEDQEYLSTVGRNWLQGLLSKPIEERTMVDSLMIGESLIGFQAVRSRGRSANRREATQRMTGLATEDITAVADDLMQLAASGYSPAGRLLAIVSAFAFRSVVDRARVGVDGRDIRLVRSLERGLRYQLYSSKQRTELWSFGRQIGRTGRDVILHRPTTWIRFIRRCAIDQLAHVKEHEARPLLTWPYEQLLLAVKRERSYSNASALERRYALWVLLEIIHRLPERFDAQRSDFLARTMSVANNHEELAGLCSIDFSDAPHDWTQWRPTAGWPCPTSVEDALSQIGRVPSHYSVKGRKVKVADALSSLIAEAFTTPCAIRFGTAADALTAIPSDLVDFVLRAVLDTSRKLQKKFTDGDASTAPYLERCILLLGHLGLTPATTSHLCRTSRDETVAPWLRRACLWELSEAREEGLLTPECLAMLRSLEDTDGLVGRAATSAIESLATAWPTLGRNLQGETPVDHLHVPSYDG